MSKNEPVSPSGQSPKISTTVPHSPRIWNYWLGGKDNYEVDREVGDQFTAIYPAIVDVARQSRAFLQRAVTHLTATEGVRQFLDIGTGLPTANNTHEVAQRVAPDARVVYTDNDPVVLAHARALLTGSTEGSTQYIDADLRSPEAIFTAARELLDFDRPVALMLLNILGHIEDHDEALSIVGRLVDALPAGSYLVTADGTHVITGKAFEDAIELWNRNGEPTYHLRHPDQIARFHDGLELLEPGIVSCPRWRPDDPSAQAADVDEFCGVSRKS
ncbi:SAM-dependent methyltransferase [Streptomyces triticagri]|uniref:SAM-dependent methyltransferase n=1 Tax=Streptomyces triticagri TaxID=2293568 RepID=A0A372LZN4_9ACTN|nr:SAM-dependent methyltransferase [Streptomyces triticagri]RFU83487.1 SAM-dependent methyltransferase [Streptomyces triticagri]